MTEIWRPIPSLPEYEASSWGRIRRVVFWTQLHHGGWRRYGGKPRLGGLLNSGRRNFHFRGQNYSVARVVCEAFNGPPFPNAFCLHLNDDPSDNRPDNLKWGTHKENTSTPTFKAHCRQARLRRAAA